MVVAARTGSLGCLSSASSSTLNNNNHTTNVEEAVVSKKRPMLDQRPSSHSTLSLNQLMSYELLISTRSATTTTTPKVSQDGGESPVDAAGVTQKSLPDLCGVYGDQGSLNDEEEEEEVVTSLSTSSTASSGEAVTSHQESSSDESSSAESPSKSVAPSPPDEEDEEEEEDGIVFPSDMTVIVDEPRCCAKSPSSSESAKSLSNYLATDEASYSASTAAKLVNSISDENLTAAARFEPGSPETPPSALLAKPQPRHQHQPALTKQSSFLSSGKSTISSVHSNSLACEVTSLSSMTSDYSQFEFLSPAQVVKPPAAAADQCPPPPPTAVVSSSGGGGLSSFFFSNGLFGSGKKQKQLMSSALATSEDKSVKLVVPSTPPPPPPPASSRLDSFTNKLLNFKPSNKNSSFNVTSPPPPGSSNITKFFFSSSKPTAAQAADSPAAPHQQSPDTASIKSNHSVNNLSSIVAAGLQVPNSVLIFENRPSNLPAKSQQEALKHQREYEKMVESAKRKEAKEKEMRMRKYEQQMRKEDFMANSLKIWNQEILANWTELKDARRTHQLWWHGLPPSIRGKVWRLAIGNELNLTKESYYHYERKAKEKLEILNKLNTNSTDLNEEEKRAMSASLDQDRTHESSVELIKLDVSRTFPQLCFFQRDGPYHDALHGVLGAYACYNTKIGYVQGMSFLTAILLLNMEAPDAFICLSNLLNTKYLLACFCMNQTQMNRYFKAHQILLEHNLPKLYRHFEEQKVKPDLYLIEWIFTLFSKSLPLDVVSRVWDVFLRDHEEFLFRTALGILNLYKDALLKMDFIHIVQFLTKLPENINSTQLFKSIEQISTTIDETYFTFNHLIGDI